MGRASFFNIVPICSTRNFRDWTTHRSGVANGSKTCAIMSTRRKFTHKRICIRFGQRRRIGWRGSLAAETVRFKEAPSPPSSSASCNSLGGNLTRLGTRSGSSFYASYFGGWPCFRSLTPSYPTTGLDFPSELRPRSFEEADVPRWVGQRRHNKLPSD